MFPCNVRKVPIAILALASWLAAAPLAERDTAVAPTSPSTVSFLAHWKVGDSVVFRVRQTKTRRQADTLVSQDTASYEAVLRVASRDARDSSFTIKWVYQNDLGNSFKLSEPMRRRLAKYDRIELEYRAAATGEFLGIVGWLRQSRMMSRMMEDIVQAVAEDKSVPPEEIRTTMTPFLEGLTSKEGLESVVFKDVRLVHFALGAEFQTDSVLEYEDQFPNVFGGDPIPTRGTMRASLVSPGIAALDQIAQADPAQTRSMVLGLMRKMMHADSVLKLAANMSMELQDRNRYEIGLATGFPQRIHTYRKVLVNIPGQRAMNEEVISIERIR